MKSGLINDKKIAFILCVNNQMYLDECCAYLERLTVPDGYEVEVFPIWDSSSMCQAYNIGMNASDAKYKVYIHQDVFIVEENFLNNIVNIFRDNKDIGMIGMTGATDIPMSGVFFNVCNTGKVEVREQDLSYYYVAGRGRQQLTDVEAVDGMLIATQYDIAWREDLFINFDFYDVSQGLEFKKRGFRVVVPYQTKPWIMHDCGFPKLDKYENNRYIFIDNYSEYLTDIYKQKFEYHNEMVELENQLCKIISDLIETGEWDEIEKILNEYRKINIKHTEIEKQCNLYEIYRAEQRDSVKADSCFFSIKEMTYQQIIEKYDHIRFTMRRYELGWKDYCTADYEKKLLNKEISIPSVLAMVPHATLYRYDFISRLVLLEKKSDYNEYRCKLEPILHMDNIRKINIAYGRRYE